MHAPAEWKLYDKCGVHQLTSKDKDIFMLVEKEYPLRMDDVLPPRVENEDSDEEVDAVDVLRIDNFIQNSKQEYSKSEDSDFNNPLLPLLPLEPPDKGLDFEIKISVIRSVIVKFECINARVKFDVFNDENNVLSYFMFKEFSFLSAESEDTISDPGSKVVQHSGIQCFNCKEYGHFAKECRKPIRVKDSTYHKEKMMLYKQAEQGVSLQAEQYDWLADTDEEVDEQELEV
nr:hypothetical protein [Tanacetum cinerariifolium]